MADHKTLQANFRDRPIPHLRELIFGNLLGLMVTLLFVVLAKTSPEGLGEESFEDGLIEIFTLVWLACACICFVIAANRSDYLRSKSGAFKYFFTISWAALMFILLGEESSWGQWIFGFEVPESIKAVNTQDEFNLHNIWWLQQSGTSWRTYRIISLFTLTTGFLLPILAMSEPFRRLIQRFAFPVMPMSYCAFFLGSYIYGKYYYNILPGDTASEVRELLMAIGLFVFALHGAIRPNDLFRVEKVEQASGTSPP